MKVYGLDEIKKAIDIPFLLSEVERGFVHYSNGECVTSPVGFLEFNSPRGDVHIKSGAVKKDDYYVVKVASGFYENPKIGLSSCNGLMLLFSQTTGELQSILLDEGRLTDLRTGIAGAIAAKYLAPRNIDRIGVIGTGIQAREQLRCLEYVTTCRDVYVWGRNSSRAHELTKDPLLKNFSIRVADSVDELAKASQLIITTTSSTTPLIYKNQLSPGTHITAVGADGGGKRELDLSIFESAQLVTVDSLSQCSSYGEFSFAKHLQHLNVVELGELIKSPYQRNEGDITIADLTGVAVQDLQIAKGIVKSIKK
ncbi:MAG: deaminase [Chlamydiota bacterium]